MINNNATVNTVSQTDASAAMQPTVLAERYKTRTCKTFMATGRCPYYHRCMFAHGHHELRTVEMNMRDGLMTKAAIAKVQRAVQAHRQDERVHGIPASGEARLGLVDFIEAAAAQKYHLASYNAGYGEEYGVSLQSYATPQCHVFDDTTSIDSDHSVSWSSQKSPEDSTAEIAMCTRGRRRRPSAENSYTHNPYAISVLPHQ